MIRAARGDKAALILLSVLVLIFTSLTFTYSGFLMNAPPSMKNDFTSYYVAGLAVREGIPDALYYPEPVGSLLAQASRQHPWIDLARSAGIENPNYYLYPPLFAVMFTPMTLLPYKVAYAVWVAVGAGCFGLSLLLLVRLAGGSLRNAEGLLAAAAVVLIGCLFYPVSRTLAVGQSSLMLLLLMAACLWLLRLGGGKGDAGAGLCLAGGIMLKLTPVIFLPWLVLTRRWRALGYTLLWFALLLVPSLIAVGLEPHRVFLTKMLGHLSGGTAFYPNQSAVGLANRLAGGDLRLADLAEPASAAVRLGKLAGLAIIGASFALIWRRERTAGQLGSDRTACLENGFSLLILASLIASPISWEHHYVLALIPAAVIVRRLSQGAFGRWWVAGAGICLALIGSYVGLRVIEGFGSEVWVQVSASTCLLGALGLWGLLAITGTAESRPPGGAPARGAAAGILVLMSVFCAVNFATKLMEYNRSYAYGDFTSYYIAAATLREGEGRPLYYPDTPDMILARAETESPWTETAARWGVRDANYYLYPPFFAMAMVPLAFLPYPTAHSVWYLVNIAALAGSAWLYIASRRREITAGETALAVIAISLSWPALFTFGAGQANFVVLLCLVASLAALRSGREVLAGLMTAAAVAVKMTPALLLIYLAWTRRWKALATSIAALLALGLAGAATTGWDAYFVYKNEMLPLLSRGSAHWVNESPTGFFTRLVDSADMFSWSLADPSAMSRLLISLSALLIVGATFGLIGWRYLIRRSEAKAPSQGGRLDLEFSLVVVATLFVSPLSWTHHSVLSLLGFLLAARWLISRGELTFGWLVCLGTAYTMVNIYVKPPGLFEHGLLRVLASYNLAGNLLLWGMLAVMLVRARRSAGGEVSA